MKFIVCACLMVICQTTYAQYGNMENQNLTNAMNGFFMYSTSPQQAAGFGQAAVNRSVGAATRDISEAAINYETAYEMKLNNSLLRVNTYFEMRQSNRYYKELELLQKTELRKLKASGQLDIETLNHLYNRGSGFRIP